MRKLFLLIMLLAAFSLFAQWEVGEVISQDYSWTDNSGEAHSIHELTAAGKVVYIFWGTAG
ncbi:MAG: hypothetical protein PHR06_00300 [Candidatus Cloacimonetes bacterium]|nr:hypothetical protein [Candidatus Cloacimonadota bacterium]